MPCETPRAKPPIAASPFAPRGRPDHAAHGEDSHLLNSAGHRRLDLDPLARIPRDNGLLPCIADRLAHVRNGVRRVLTVVLTRLVDAGAQLANLVPSLDDIDLGG